MSSITWPAWVLSLLLVGWFVVISLGSFAPTPAEWLPQRAVQWRESYRGWRLDVWIHFIAYGVFGYLLSAVLARARHAASGSTVRLDHGTEWASSAGRTANGPAGNHSDVKRLPYAAGGGGVRAAAWRALLSASPSVMPSLDEVSTPSLLTVGGRSALTGTLLGLVLEMLQGMVPEVARPFQWEDCAANAAGSVAGAVAFGLGHRRPRTARADTLML
ncbi:hypothetical protein CDCA_CDCA02G0478 [Cyanidium caldarium]|uniref:VanZ-like domain-containing protein n=1 Tax=Cyanidium caldarium TaxID=2771 RepID=A0AAV9IRA8_CYACA|nr:hypothetical protein CDCA_CDCA02G0478 [Cyanidium caldarium]